MQVAVLGTGAMGAGMTRSLLRAGHTVRVWNRTAARAEPLAADGATVAASPAEAVRGAEVVLVVLFDTAAVLEVLAAAAGVAEPDAVWLQASTIGPDGTERVAALAAERGLRLVDAPVLGTKGAGRAGQARRAAVRRPGGRRGGRPGPRGDLGPHRVTRASGWARPAR